MTFTGENVFIVNSSYTASGCSFHAHSGNQWLDLTGALSNTLTTGLAQKVTTIPGHVYQLSFWVGNTTCNSQTSGTTSSVIVSLNPGPTFPPATNSLPNPTDLVWQQFSDTFTAGPGNSTTITFFNDDPSTDNVNGLDDVVLTDLTAANCVQPPNTTMVAWYPFDELTGITSANLATANTGVQNNGPLGTASGKVGFAALFNGSNQYVQSPDSIVTNFGPAHDAAFCSATPISREGDYSTCRGNFSIDTWIKAGRVSSSNIGTILVKEAVVPFPFSSAYGYGLFLSNSNQLVLELADGGAADYFSPILPPLSGQWHHIAVTVDRLLPNGITWYLDGICVGFSGCTTNDPTNRVGSLVNRSPLVIGANFGASTFPYNLFSGALDELEVHNRVLTPQEILLIFNAGQYGKCKP